MIAATAASTAKAIHTGRKRAATTALAANVLTGAVTAVPLRGGARAEG